LDWEVVAIILLGGAAIAGLYHLGEYRRLYLNATTPEEDERAEREEQQREEQRGTAHPAI
jgi:hypothetical protein